MNVYKYIKIQIVTLPIAIGFTTISFADLRIIYENQQKNEQKYEIIIKNNEFKMKNYENRITYIDFDHNTVCFYTEGDQKFIKLGLKTGENENIKETKDFFKPNLEYTKEKTKIARIDTDVYRYRSVIDDTVKVFEAKMFDSKIVEVLTKALTNLAFSGNEFLKQPAYYYSLKKGFVPLAFKGKEIDWKATFVESKEIPKEEFSIPSSMKEQSLQEYLKDVVDKISKDVESKPKP